MNDPDNHTAERSFRFDEKCLSQIPALQVLVNLGYQYLPPAVALAGQWRLPLTQGDDEHV